MTKPKNFPGRREARQAKAMGIIISPEAGKRTTKKTPKSTWSPGRAANNGGKIAR